MTIIRPTTINARFSQPVGLGGEKLWLCPTLGGDRLDLSGNGSHGTYNGGMGTVVDKSNGGIRAYSFDASNDFIDVSNLDLGGLSKFTWSAWIYDDYPYWRYNAHSGMFSHRFAGGFTQEIYFFVYTASRVVFQVNNGADGSELYASNYRSWIHACVVYDGTQPSSNDRIKYYVNGTLQTYTSTYPVPTSLTTTTITPITRIGHYASVSTTNTVHYFGGKQDDIRVFKRAISTSEVKHLASKRGVLGSPRQPYDPFKRTVVRVPAAIPAATKVGSFKKPTTIIKPSYQAGYARNASESENPQLWDGLVGAWMPSLGVTGYALRDVSGNGNHGTRIDFASDWVATSKGFALDFDGFDDYVDCGRPSMGVGKLTVNVWINLTAGNTFQHLVDSSSNSWHLALLGTNKPYLYNGVTFHTSTETLSTNTWYMITGVQGSTLDLYVNGVLSQSISSNVNVTTNNINIGRWQDGNRNFNGKLSNVCIYNRALSPQEIKHLYVDSLAPFRRKQRVSVAVPAAVAPSATYHPLRSLAHPLEQ